MFKDFETFRKIEEPHKEIHKYVLDAIQFVEGKDRLLEYKDRVLEDFKKTEEASEKLYKYLDKLSEEFEQHELSKISDRNHSKEE